MGHAHSSHSAASRNKHRLAIVLGLTTVYLVAEVLGAIFTKSLALFADAGHMLTDAGGLALSLFAIWLSEKPATPKRTYGYYRAEILAAVANAVILIGVSFYILFEAYERFKNPPQVASIPMVAVAVVGLIVNVVGLLLLREGSKESLNLKGAYFEVFSDLLTSVGVIAAGVIMWTTGWYYADPIISAGIGLFILPRTWILLKDAVGVLLEGAPSHVNLGELREAIKAVQGVADVHDLHVWTITSGVNALSVHVVLANQAIYSEVLAAARNCVVSRFEIGHVTIQVEPHGFDEEETHL